MTRIPNLFEKSKPPEDGPEVRPKPPKPTETSKPTKHTKLSQPTQPMRPPLRRFLSSSDKDLLSSLEDIPSIMEEAQISEISDSTSEYSLSTNNSTSLGTIYSDASETDSSD